MLVNTLSHEIAHDFGLEHLGADGQPSNESSAYPSEGLMKSADPFRITPATEENFIDMENNVPNKEK